MLPIHYQTTQRVQGREKTRLLSLIFVRSVYDEFLMPFVPVQGELPPGDLGAPESLRRLLSLVREMLSCGDGRLAPLPQRQLDVPALLQQVGCPCRHLSEGAGHREMRPLKSQR